jgi:hypothetical protein
MLLHWHIWENPIRYRQRQDMEYVSDFDLEIKLIENKKP